MGGSWRDATPPASQPCTHIHLSQPARQHSRAGGASLTRCAWRRTVCMAPSAGMAGTGLVSLAHCCGLPKADSAAHRPAPHRPRHPPGWPAQLARCWPSACNQGELGQRSKASAPALRRRRRKAVRQGTAQPSPAWLSRARPAHHKPLRPGSEGRRWWRARLQPLGPQRTESDRTAAAGAYSRQVPHNNTQRYALNRIVNGAGA